MFLTPHHNKNSSIERNSFEDGGEACEYSLQISEAAYFTDGCPRVPITCLRFL